MKTKKILSSLLLTALLSLSSAAMAQKDILLYSTDFTDWLQMDGTSGSSDDVFQGSGAGTGFTLGDKPQVFPDGTIGGATGYLTINNGPNNGIDCKELDFIAGGAVEIEFVNKTGSNTRWVGIQGADAVLVESLEPTDGRYDRAHVGTLSGTNYSAGTALGDKTGPTASLFNTWVNGFNGVDNNGTGVTKVSFRLPASFTGTKRIKLVMHKDIAITSLKIYTTVGTTPYVSSTDYPNAGADGSKTSAGLTIQGAVSGPAVTGTVNVKAYNITSPVTLSIEERMRRSSRSLRPPSTTPLPSPVPTSPSPSRRLSSRALPMPSSNSQPMASQHPTTSTSSVSPDLPTRRSSPPPPRSTSGPTRPASSLRCLT